MGLLCGVKRDRTIIACYEDLIRTRICSVIGKLVGNDPAWANSSLGEVSVVEAHLRQLGREAFK